MLALARWLVWELDDRASREEQSHDIIKVFIHSHPQRHFKLEVEPPQPIGTRVDKLLTHFDIPIEEASPPPLSCMLIGLTLVVFDEVKECTKEATYLPSKEVKVKGESTTINRNN